MIKFLTTFLIFSLLPIAANSIQITTRFSYVTNLIYQLDCVSKNVSFCKSKNFQELWDKEFLKNPNDREHLLKWVQIQKKYKTNADLNVKEQHSIDLSHKVRIASFDARDLQDYLSRLDLVMIFSDRLEAEKIVRHFDGPFRKWWAKNANQKGLSYNSKIQILLKKKNIKQAIDQFAHFYESQLPSDYSLSLNLLYRPEFFKESTGGQQLDNYALSEFITSEDPARRLDVILHELCHFLFKTAPEEKFSKLKNRFDTFNSLRATAAYNLLDETLATAFGNGLINKMMMPADKWLKYLAKENSFYTDYYIDSGAKNIMSLLEASLNNNQTLYSESFIPNYVQTLAGYFGQKLEAPKSLLRHIYFLYDDSFNHDFEDNLHSSFKITSAHWGDFSDKEFIKKMQADLNQSLLIVLNSKNKNQLTRHDLVTPKELKLLTKELLKNSSVLYSLPRSPSAMTYIIIAPSKDQALEEIKTLGMINSHFNGVYKK